MRRSPQMSEPFTFDVSYDTKFDQIERLRQLMISFLENDRRDYHPMFDVLVMGECSQISTEWKLIAFQTSLARRK